MSNQIGCIVTDVVAYGMPRATPAGIRDEIVDETSALIARHGFANTSLQQIADAVGYSKAGILRYFPTKTAIFAAAIDAVREQASTLLKAVEGIESGFARDRSALEHMVGQVYLRPGVSAMVSNLVALDSPAGEPDALESAGMAVLTAFGLDPEPLDQQRLVRVVVATQGACIAAQTAVRVDLKREWRDHIIRAALDALGHVQHRVEGKEVER